MFFPHHYVIVFQFTDSSICQFYRTRQCIRNNAQASRTERLGFRNHAPKQLGCHILFQVFRIVRHGHQFYRVCMNRSSVRRTLTQKVIVYTEVRRKFRSRLHRIIGDDYIRSTVIQDADDRTVFHRPTGQVTHTHVGSLAIKITSLQVRQSSSNLINFTDGRQCTDFIVYIFCNIDSNVTTVAFCPTFFPQITGYFGHLIHFACQCRAIIQY